MKQGGGGNMEGVRRLLTIAYCAWSFLLSKYHILRQYTFLSASSNMAGVFCAVFYPDQETSCLCALGETVAKAKRETLELSKEMDERDARSRSIMACMHTVVKFAFFFFFLSFFPPSFLSFLFSFVLTSTLPFLPPLIFYNTSFVLVRHLQRSYQGS